MARPQSDTHPLVIVVKLHYDLLTYKVNPMSSSLGGSKEQHDQIDVVMMHALWPG